MWKLQFPTRSAVHRHGRQNGLPNVERKSDAQSSDPSSAPSSGCQAAVPLLLRSQDGKIANKTKQLLISEAPRFKRTRHYNLSTSRWIPSLFASDTCKGCCPGMQRGSVNNVLCSRVTHSGIQKPIWRMSMPKELDIEEGILQHNPSTITTLPQGQLRYHLLK